MDDDRKTIIYVDDINFSLITVKNRLRDYYEVYPAQSVSIMFNILEQFEKLKNTMPDVILLDLNMPEVDGFEAITMLKSNPLYADIPVIFLSAQRDKESVVKGIRLGAAAHVGKPFTDSELIDTISYVLDPDARKWSVHEDDTDDGRPRILAVDDVPAMLRAINHALKDLYKVYMLSKPEEMRDFLKRNTVDLFLLDYNMPGLSGFDLIPVIREFREHDRTPIIFLTAEGTISNLAAAINLGASDFLVKPFQAKVLRDKIKKYLHKGD